MGFLAEAKLELNRALQLLPPTHPLHAQVNQDLSILSMPTIDAASGVTTSVGAEADAH